MEKYQHKKRKKMRAIGTMKPCEEKKKNLGYRSKQSGKMFPTRVEVHAGIQSLL
jgi:hypothetical protein